MVVVVVQLHVQVVRQGCAVVAVHFAHDAEHAWELESAVVFAVAVKLDVVVQHSSSTDYPAHVLELAQALVPALAVGQAQVPVLEAR